MNIDDLDELEPMEVTEEQMQTLLELEQCVQTILPTTRRTSGTYPCFAPVDCGKNCERLGLHFIRRIP